MPKPRNAKRPPSAPKRPSFGIQVTNRTNTPRIAYSQVSGSATNTLAPAAAPITEPMMNGTSVPRITCRHMIIVRAAPVPSITTVCTGISAAGGITIAISASSSTPPAAPVKTPMKPETNDARDRPAKRSGPISGVKRKSILVVVSCLFERRARGGTGGDPGRT